MTHYKILLKEDFDYESGNFYRFILNERGWVLCEARANPTDEWKEGAGLWNDRQWDDHTASIINSLVKKLIPLRFLED